MVVELKPMGKPTNLENTKVLDRTRASYGPQTQAHGETNFLKEKTKVLDRTKAFYGSRTQAYGETNYLQEKQRFWTEPRHCTVLGLKPMGKPTNWEKTKVLDRTKAMYGPRTQAYGETNYLRKKQWFWTERRHCMVLGLKPMGKATTWEKTKVLDRTKALYGPRTQANGETNYLRKNKSFGQNQGIVRSSESSLWRNQLPEKKQRFWAEPRQCTVLGLKPMGKPTTRE